MEGKHKLTPCMIGMAHTYVLRKINFQALCQEKEQTSLEVRLMAPDRDWGQNK